MDMNHYLMRTEPVNYVSTLTWTKIIENLSTQKNPQPQWYTEQSLETIKYPKKSSNFGADTISLQMLKPWLGHIKILAFFSTL